MESPICPACGCSLVRLGITQKKALSHHYQDKQYWFCCNGCLDLFKTNSEQCLNETSNLVVCPVCLAEKLISTTVKHSINGILFNFCRCPYCLTVFNQDQNYFIKRLAWQTDYKEVFADKNEGCKKTVVSFTDVIR